MIEAIKVQQIEQRRPPVHTGIYRADLMNQHPALKKRPYVKTPKEGAPLFKQRSVSPQYAPEMDIPELDTANYGAHRFETPRIGMYGPEPGAPRGSYYTTDRMYTDRMPSDRMSSDRMSEEVLYEEDPSPGAGLGKFFRAMALPVGVLAVAIGFFVISGSTWTIMTPVVTPVINPQEDTMYSRDLAAYAGVPVPGTQSSDTPSADIQSPASALPDTVSGAEGEEIPLDLMESFAWNSYTVQKGDSVSKIAADHSLSLDAVIASNNITNARRLSVGQVIRLPNMDGIPYTVKRGDSLTKISSTQGVPLTALLDANDIQSDNISPGTIIFLPGVRMPTEELKLALGEAFAWPIRGRLSSPYGWRNDPISGARKHHAALDLAANKGTPIKAAMDGKVASVGYNGTYGNYIILTHSNGYQTMYAHMSATSVKQGARVNQGTKIGEVGSTGYSTGNHLHFAIYKNGRAVNPLDFLNQ